MASEQLKLDNQEHSLKQSKFPSQVPDPFLLLNLIYVGLLMIIQEQLETFS